MTNFFAVSHLGEMSPLEVHRLYKLRVDIFVHEQQTPYAEIEDIDAADSTMHVLAWSAHRLSEDLTRDLVGTARLFLDTWAGEEVVRLGRIAVAAEQRGSGLATELIHQSLRFAAERAPEHDVIIAAQEKLQSYYEDFGFRASGDSFDDAGVPHVPMLLPAAELATRLKAIFPETA